MTRLRRPPRDRRSRWFVVLVVLLALGLSPGAAAETPGDLSFQVSFGELIPGEPTRREASFEVDREVRLSAFAWVRREGILDAAQLSVRLCDSAEVCVDAVPAGDSTVLGPGRITAHVTAELPDPGPATPGEGSAVGRLTLTGGDDPDDDPTASPSPPPGSAAALPGTGAGEDTMILLAWGVAALLVGAALVAWAARVRRGER